MEDVNNLWQTYFQNADKVYLKKKEAIILEGEVTESVYYVKNGCLRSWFNKDGNDVSFQFFLEGSFLLSFDSFMYDEPSLFTVEAILPTTLYVIPKKQFKEKIAESSELKNAVFRVVCERMRHYQRLFLSRIKDTPQERYEELVKNNSDLLRKIPQHYIASYLGITSVSLSRIRCRK
ncbi:Crp/Fnr family transcriptional regulator [Corallincola luteus]|uniref:Crp/Fnr family transcriptional regulator n=1 Tax=Corallincola luteus TaxID=1775177 RepID=UPI0013F43D9C|nr:Crp/Fnr family transcriptional regulator [Corallincola luteus]